jgi:hypothetical protein
MAKVHPLYVAPSLAGVYLPPAMASFAEKGHYTHNGLRGLGASRITSFDFTTPRFSSQESAKDRAKGISNYLVVINGQIKATGATQSQVEKITALVKPVLEANYPNLAPVEAELQKQLAANGLAQLSNEQLSEGREKAGVSSKMNWPVLAGGALAAFVLFRMLNK